MSQHAVSADAQPGNLDPFLPGTWVHRIWSAMRGNYGAEFDRRWQCPEGTDPEVHVQQLRETWQRELRCFRTFPEAISYGLENLPPRPPSLPEFRAICLRAPARAQPAQAPLLPPVARDRPRLAAELGRAVEALSKRKPTACLEEMEAKVARGETLTPGQRQWLRNAQENRPPGLAMPTDFRGVDPAKMPASMRGGAR